MATFAEKRTFPQAQPPAISSAIRSSEHDRFEPGSPRRRKRDRAAIAAIPDGTYRADGMLDNDGVTANDAEAFEIAQPEPWNAASLITSPSSVPW